MQVGMLAAPRQVQLVERPREPLSWGEVRLQVLGCGVCASEVALWTGKAEVDYPRSLGHEVGGVVQEVGPGVSDLQVGDSVAAWVLRGGFAREAVAEERYCVKVRPDLPFSWAGEPLSCVVNAVELAAPALANDVVLIGAGFMGNLVQQVTALRGPRSIVVADIRPDALATAQKLGAHRVVDLRSESLEEVVAEVSGGHGADLTYEVTGTNEGLVLAGQVTRMSGKICIVGYHQGGHRSIPLAHWNWMAFNILNAHFREPATIMHGMRVGMRLVEAGLLDLRVLVTNTYGLAAVNEAFEAASSRGDGFIKAVVEPAG